MINIDNLSSHQSAASVWRLENFIRTFSRGISAGGPVSSCLRSPVCCQLFVFPLDLMSFFQLLNHLFFQFVAAMVQSTGKDSQEDVVSATPQESTRTSRPATREGIATRSKTSSKSPKSDAKVGASVKSVEKLVTSAVKDLTVTLDPVAVNVTELLKEAVTSEKAVPTPMGKENDKDASKEKEGTTEPACVRKQTKPALPITSRVPRTLGSAVVVSKTSATTTATATVSKKVASATLSTNTFGELGIDYSMIFFFNNSTPKKF